jgi:hypothetical protein
MSTETTETTLHHKHPTDSILNEYFRMAFQALARAALPHMDVADAYISDLLWDANNAASMDVGDVCYLVVRPTSTSWFVSADELIRGTIGAQPIGLPDTKAVLRVERLTYRFNVEVL